MALPFVTFMHTETNKEVSIVLDEGHADWRLVEDLFGGRVQLIVQGNILVHPPVDREGKHKGYTRMIFPGGSRWPVAVTQTLAGTPNVSQVLEQLPFMVGTAVVHALEKSQFAHTLSSAVISALEERQAQRGSSASGMSFIKFLGYLPRLGLSLNTRGSLPLQYQESQCSLDSSASVPPLTWGNMRENDAVLEAEQLLQQHYTPQLQGGNKIVWFGVQHVNWLEASWPPLQINQPLGKTNYVAVVDCSAAHNLVEEIEQVREKMRQFCVLSHPTKEQKGEVDALAGSMCALLVSLLPYIAAMYEAKTTRNLLGTKQKRHWAQAGAKYLQLRKMQRDLRPNHPDTPVILGDFDSHRIIEMAPKSSSTLLMRVTGPSQRTAAANYLRDRIHASAVKIIADPGPSAECPFDPSDLGGSGGAGGSGGGHSDLGSPEQGSLPKDSSDRAGDGPMAMDASVDDDYPGMQAQLAAQDLVDYFKLPSVKEALGINSAPLYELDEWGESMTIKI